MILQTEEGGVTWHRRLRCKNRGLTVIHANKLKGREGGDFGGPKGASWGQPLAAAAGVVRLCQRAGRDDLAADAVTTARYGDG